MKPIITLLILVVTLSQPFSLMAYDTAQRQEVQRILVREAQQQQLDPSLALAIAKVESDFQADALSHAGARGVMQIMPKTAETEFGVSRHRLYDPNTNVQVGVSFIKHLINVYDGRVDIALSHYNGGSAVKTKSGQLRVIPATRDYVDKVLAYRNEFASNPWWLSRNKSPVVQSAKQQSRYAIAMAKNPSTDLSQAGVTKTHSLKGNPGDSRLVRLRDLQLHNLTRHAEKTMRSKPQEIVYRTEPSRQKKDSISAKVRRWESIFDPQAGKTQ